MSRENKRASQETDAGALTGTEIARISREVSPGVWSSLRTTLSKIAKLAFPTGGNDGDVLIRVSGEPAWAPLLAGGGSSEWLPEGAIAFLDFVNGHYYAGGAEQQNVADIFPVSSSIVPGVGFTNGSAFMTTGAFFDAVSPGATWVLEFEGSIECSLLSSDLASFSQGTSAFVNYSPPGDGVFDATPPEITGRYRVACTLTGTKAARSIRGNPTISVTGAGFTVASAFASVAGTLRSITIYPARADADLPGLSRGDVVVGGATGTFTDPVGKSVTVENGVITKIASP